MEDDRLTQFYKAATRAGLSSALPTALRPQIVQQVHKEDQEAPLQADCSPRSNSSAQKNRAAKAASSCSGGVCQTPGQAGRAEIVKLSARGSGSAQLTEDSLVKHKYFNQTEIENLKMRRLQDIAENDRQVSGFLFAYRSKDSPVSSQKVMSVLSPVVSLLDGLQLADNTDQDMLEDIKLRLSCIGGPNSGPASCPGSGHSTARKSGRRAIQTQNIRGAKTSAIRPYTPSPKCIDSSASEGQSESEESYMEQHMMETGCGIFAGLASSLRSLIAWAHPTEAISEEKQEIAYGSPQMPAATASKNVHFPARMEISLNGEAASPNKSMLLSPGSILPHVMSPSHARINQRMTVAL